MKIAIVHDWLVTFAGAERVLAELIKLWPQADLFSVIDFLSDADRTKLSGKHAKTTLIQNLPKAKTRYQMYLPFMPFAIEQVDLSGYDLVISSSHAVAKGVITGPDQLHICYCYSPIRYAWDMQHQYLAETGLDSGLKGFLARLLLFKVRNWDHRTSNGVDYFISDSDYIGRRIRKAYRRDSTTIYPNVAIDDFPLHTAKEDFYLTASRMVPYKKMDLVVRAFAAMPDKKLVVIGEGPQYNKIKQAITPNVTLLGYQPFDVLRDHMQRARAFVFAAEEDFGIVPVEAQACGTPVIAFGKGGARETVAEGKTGIFFNEQTEKSIQAAVRMFEADFRVDPAAIRQHAEYFSTERFRREIKNFVEEKYTAFFQYRKSSEE
ncbi:glycosyltransferase family 4 protein [Pollutimonas bauzanensis]|uniref:Glycosyltransferase involved in cell wall bisynthesis n=1 Tax=Pollutimonas bauzanensis TaxID=658167 RepID=A0A1M6BL87_9BURK|nr:glycosyltransferase family 4 protein [Pollutimonas bauzanensis]SHI49427.1 Glycosyltransferase involved in cell wall bisynthesis [Pollutimonas bauzanensis]